LSHFLSPFRKKVEDPWKFLPSLISKGDVVAELGCGPGYYCNYLAKLTTNTVYCVDKERDFIEEAKRYVNSQNVVFLVEDAGRTSIPSSSVDKVLLANSFHDFRDKQRVYEEIKRILKGDGKVIVVDWKKGHTGFGPPVYVRMGKEDYLRVFRDFELEAEFEPGSYHFGLVLKRKDES
jgi:ubiquinone/menaquinone biosynthesis C-methylase UbiE